MDSESRNILGRLETMANLSDQAASVTGLSSQLKIMSLDIKAFDDAQENVRCRARKDQLHDDILCKVTANSHGSSVKDKTIPRGMRKESSEKDHMKQSYTTTY
jgi:hypothetical protein